mmetsp:Transcript_65740/g.176151  ORF Transcript_65740/g.176151 Transcript_65740/m.176151 type:complete len:109 (+) Transcript_65740:1202-1528(+)
MKPRTQMKVQCGKVLKCPTREASWAAVVNESKGCVANASELGTSEDEGSLHCAFCESAGSLDSALCCIEAIGRANCSAHDKRMCSWINRIEPSKNSSGGRDNVECISE